MLSQILQFLIEKNWLCDGDALSMVMAYNTQTYLSETKYFLGSDYSDTFTVNEVSGINLDFDAHTFELKGV